jgi:5-methylcytosine-specific restriction protein A
MAIKKLCSRCNKIIDYGNTYCDKCQEIADRNKKDSVKYYNTNVRDKESQSFYNSKAWKNIVKVVKSRQHGLCLMCLESNSISYYNVIHHIVELKEDKDKALDINNLICLCSSCHAKIHGEYNKSIDTKKVMQNKLKQLINRGEWCE